MAGQSGYDSVPLITFIIGVIVIVLIVFTTVIYIGARDERQSTCRDTTSQQDPQGR